ncbi:hypothetical protein PGT21_008412 [Puccinia graminis f. sp. tritici]|uniref:Uncharacterized protein n=1 Tax=Puccinia graminis f. sp. tritici TaxID=56615 RepID=A0A5B0MLB2_PUCGR|nr:hypothetical protein PGT21_019133 [Puccinia graminis f. sp. tritici]KAA1083833.1 hypothetical protein PGT21_008412 [Puccinia graminis f. sp. tritici]
MWPCSSPLFIFNRAGYVALFLIFFHLAPLPSGASLPSLSPLSPLSPPPTHPLGLQGAPSERLIVQTINRSPERLIGRSNADQAIERLIKRSNA